MSSAVDAEQVHNVMMHHKFFILKLLNQGADADTETEAIKNDGKTLPILLMDEPPKNTLMKTQ